MRPLELGRVGACLAAFLISCATPKGSMLDYSHLKSSYAGEFFAHEQTLVLRVENPVGLTVVPYPPRLEEGRVVVFAGLVSSGGSGERFHGFEISALDPPPDWASLLFWREPDGRLAPVACRHGDEARRLTRRCS